MNLDLNEELLEPDTSETDTSDFEFRTPLTPWEDVDDAIVQTKVPILSNRFDATSWNTHGIVHVRILCAQRLPCPVGSSVCASVSLPPYKGRVKTGRKIAFLVSLEHGVCVQWDHPNEQENLDVVHENDDDGLCSMVNGWSSEDSPVPSIKIDLMFSPLGMGLFDFTMASVELSCVVLLTKPGEWRERWVQMEISSTLQSGSGIDRNSGNSSYFHRFPLVKLQAVFTPSIPSSGESKTMFGFGSREIDHKPPPLSKVHPFIVMPHVGVGGNESKRKEVSDAFLRRENSDETLSLSALDAVKSKRILRESDSKEKEAIDEEQKGEETDSDSVGESMTSIVHESDFPPDSPVSIQERDDASLLSKSLQTQAALDPHLLRADTYWVPGSCAVCARVLIGKNGGFHCERCGIDCCSDCRLNVDIRTPCGSDLALEFVNKTWQAKLSLSSLLNYVAPDESFEQKRIEDSIHGFHHLDRNSKFASGGPVIQDLLGDQDGIGQFRVEVVTACLFQQTLPAWSSIRLGGTMGQGNSSKSSASVLRKGDYYVRISSSEGDKTLRTPTLQSSGMPNFNSSEMNFLLFHYGVRFRIDVVEANTESIVGSAFLTTQGILQEQRDLFVAKHGASLLQCFKGPISWNGKRRVQLELRSGIRSGMNEDVYSLLAKGRVNKENGYQVGAISGWIEINVGVEEFNNRLYGRMPIQCRDRPPADLNIGNFSDHIARFKAVVSDLNAAIEDLKYAVSWKNPLLSGISLYAFVWLCLSFNAEYSGSLPLLFLLMSCGYCSYQRGQGRVQRRFIREELESIQRVEGCSVAYDFHRPMGLLRVAVSKGRGLLSRDLGISGKVSCHIYFDQMRYADAQLRDKILRADKSLVTPLEIGRTPILYTAHPDWDGMKESVTSKRLKQLIPASGRDFFEAPHATDDGTMLQSISFPILQPIEITRSKMDDKGRFSGGGLLPWDRSKGAIVVQVKFQDFLNNLPGFDHFIGEVVFPFAEIVKNGRVEGWFKVLEVGTNLFVPLEHNDTVGDQLGGTAGSPRIFLELEWSPPPMSSSKEPEESEKELSYAIQEEYVRSSALYKENKFDLVGSSIGAVNTALGIGGTVQVLQNTLGSILDVTEAGINAFNFTDPFKSSVVFAALFVVWMILMVIPTRYIVLAAGLAVNATNFIARYGKDFGVVSVQNASEAENPTHRHESAKQLKSERSVIPIATWIGNAIRSLPTNQDLRKAYFWESRRLGAAQAEKHAAEKRESRLRKLWKARWYSPLTLLTQGDESDHPTIFKKRCFAVIQGHRFLWWYSTTDFDNGEIPDGTLFLSGHAGLSGPSPLEMRELSKEEVPLCLSIFGRGVDGQQKVVMIVPDDITKDALENAVAKSSSFKKD